MVFSVLVVDDSDFTREALRRALETDPALKVVGEAKTGEEAVELARRLRPHLITMDLSMPGMGGLKAIEKIMAERPVPLVVICERSSSPGQDLNFEAMHRGALELVPKSEVFGGHQMLIQKFATRMRQLAETGVAKPPSAAPAPAVARKPSAEAPLLIGLGASTGGPRALAQVLGELPAAFPVPIAVVQHMATDFFDSFVGFLASRSKLKVCSAEAGMKASPGTVYLAPANHNLTVDRELIFRLTPNTMTSAHCPSVDALFTTMARSLHGRAVGVLMTGMGDDGAQGLLALRRVGARTIVQDAASCAVAGMPLAALALGAAEEVVELKQIATALIEDLRIHRTSEAVARTKKRILIVDDSPLLLEAGRLALEAAGYEVRTLENPLMVAMLLRKNPVDLVLLDVNMPAVQGPQVVTSLRAHGLNSTPVILYSDLDEKLLSTKAAECGATGWLRKTGDEHALIRAIDGWLGGRGRG
ncbi:MAG: response regulator receiver modulated CheB methylesterase [Myxococcaceae bacterium]|nr:response regulator receiver modulated CheB methylesterase [Myxococcaceae bacterium]